MAPDLYISHPCGLVEPMPDITHAIHISLDSPGLYLEVHTYIHICITEGNREERGEEGEGVKPYMYIYNEFLKRK